MLVRKLKKICFLALSVVLVLSSVSLNAIEAESEGSGLQVSWGLSARGGKRELIGHGMEDTHVAIEQLGENRNQAFFAVYDGHGGKQAADIAAEKLHVFLADNLKTKSIEQSLRDAFEQTDQQIELAGTTAVVAFIDGDQLYLAWAGDSRALVVRDGKVIFSTEDHKPDMPGEEKRIKSVGAHVEYHKRGPARIAGLAVSRALGDKDRKSLVPEGAIIATPEVKQIALQPDDTIVLACDGVWDVIDNDLAALIVQQALKTGKQEDVVNKLIEEKRVTPNFRQTIERAKKYGNESVSEKENNIIFSFAARMLRDFSFAFGSKDNISALVVGVDQLGVAQQGLLDRLKRLIIKIWKYRYR